MYKRQTDTISVTGGVLPESYVLTSAPSSSYITLDTSTVASNYARLIVNPLAPQGTYTETVTVTDSLGYVTTQVITVVVNAAPALAFNGSGGVITTGPRVTFQTTYGIAQSNTPFSATLGTGNKAISVTPIVSGITFDTSITNSTTMNISGIVLPGTYNETMVATDSVGATARYLILSLIHI